MADFYKYKAPDASQDVHVILMLPPFCIQNLQIWLSSVLITDFIHNTILRIVPFQTHLHVGVKEPTMSSIRSVPTSGIWATAFLVLLLVGNQEVLRQSSIQ